MAMSKLQEVLTWFENGDWSTWLIMQGVQHVAKGDGITALEKVLNLLPDDGTQLQLIASGPHTEARSLFFRLGKKAAPPSEAEIHFLGEQLLVLGLLTSELHGSAGGLHKLKKIAELLHSNAFPAATVAIATELLKGLEAYCSQNYDRITKLLEGQNQ